MVQIVPEIVQMEIPDDCMDPFLRAGDMVFVDQRRRRIHTGKVYAIVTEEGVKVRRLELISEWLVRIVCDNPLYQAQETNMNQLRILGRIVLAFRVLV
jgi:phage repressor protein C with HTH and peptisase S24 domain